MDNGVGFLLELRGDSDRLIGHSKGKGIVSFIRKDHAIANCQGIAYQLIASIGKYRQGHSCSRSRFANIGTNHTAVKVADGDFIARSAGGQDGQGAGRSAGGVGFSLRHTDMVAAGGKVL